MSSCLRTRLLLLALFLPAPQAAAAPSRPMHEIVAEVTRRAAAHDCRAAVEALREGLKLLYPEVALLAGSMYENGLCLKRDWDKAVTFYTQAHQGNLPEAADRLAAGFADPANGPDMAAAMWWGLSSRGPRLVGCEVSPGAEKDPDRFVAELSAWAPAQLALCNYVVGVISTISAEVKHPPRDRRATPAGADVVLRFLPALPRVALESGDAAVARALGAAANAKPGTVPGQNTSRYETMVRAAADLALRRYPQPAGIPPGSEITLIYRFPAE